MFAIQLQHTPPTGPGAHELCMHTSNHNSTTLIHPTPSTVLMNYAWNSIAHELCMSHGNHNTPSLLMNYACHTGTTIHPHCSWIMHVTREPQYTLIAHELCMSHGNHNTPSLLMNYACHTGTTIHPHCSWIMHVILPHTELLMNYVIYSCITFHTRFH